MSERSRRTQEFNNRIKNTPTETLSEELDSFERGKIALHTVSALTLITGLSIGVAVNTFSDDLKFPNDEEIGASIAVFGLGLAAISEFIALSMGESATTAIKELRTRGQKIQGRFIRRVSKDNQ